MFAAFLSSNQNSEEKPSAYLNRLLSLLTRTVSRGGVVAENAKELLLRQCCKGCWDLITGLQLEYKRNNHPPCPELLLMLRSEKDCRSAKLDGMKKHFGATKTAAYTHSIYNMPSYNHESVPSPDTNRVRHLCLKRKWVSYM